MIRVTHYLATASYSSTGSSSESEHAFTQEQADEVGGVLQQDGLDIVLAQKLCDKWTRMGKRGSIVYRYRLRMEDQLRQLDAERKKT